MGLRNNCQGKKYAKTSKELDKTVCKKGSNEQGKRLRKIIAIN